MMTIRRVGGLLAVAALVWGCGSTPPPTSPSPSSGTPPASGSTAATPGTSGGSPTPSGGGGVGASPSANLDVAVAPVAWSDCGGGFQCSLVRVPRDYTAPTAGSIGISVLRLAALDPSQRIGSLFVNPGGPGASGTEFVRSSAAALFPKSVRDRFDIVGFDPRGVNESSGVRCVDNLDHFLAADSTPDTAAELSTLLKGEQTFVAGCETRNGPLLPFLGTENVARDLDRLRAAVGDTKLTYIGFSYGTLIGSLYAQTFPDRIRALVLDGVLDPSLDLAQIGEAQAVAFEGALKRFLAACAAETTCAFHNGGKPGPALDALLRRIERAPLKATEIGDPRPVGPSYASNAILAALYAKADWPFLAQGLHLAQQGDGSILLLLSDPLNGRDQNGGYSDLVDANRAVSCLDFPGPGDAAAYEALARKWAREAPRFGALVAFSDIDCSFWPVPPDRVPARVSAPGAPPIVIIGSTGDPATPYPWAVSLSQQLTSSVLVTRTGEGHTGYVFSACVRTAADAYLIDLVVPGKGLTCTGG
jgi:pimeloyl-ACP methyl ester carboxylesterase